MSFPTGVRVRKDRAMPCPYMRCGGGRWEGQDPPVAVPEKIIGLTLILDFFDRCHSLGSLHPPPAALPSLPPTNRYDGYAYLPTNVILSEAHAESKDPRNTVSAVQIFGA